MDHPAPTPLPGLWLRRGLAACAACVAAVAGAAEPPLGRLFFTPERREALERQRELKQQERVIEAVQLSIDGVVARSDGRRTVWVNGAPYHDNATAGDVAAQPTREAARVRLQAGESLDTTLKVGQSVDRNSGERGDLLNGGSVSVSRPAAPTPPGGR